MRAVVSRLKKCVVEQRKVPTPAEGEVLIKVAYTALNRADTLIRRGLYPGLDPDDPQILGLEASGTIVAQGPNCSQKASSTVGSRVMSLLPSGGYAEYVAIDERLVMPVPPSMTLKQAAAIPETWLTAYQLLHYHGEVKKDDIVLIHAVGSGVGTAATQLASGVGAKVIGTASKGKLPLAESLGAEFTIDRKANEGDWSEVLLEKYPKGVDVVLDCVGGNYAKYHERVLGKDSRWVLYGLMGGRSIEPNNSLLGTLLRNRVRIQGTTLKPRSLDYKAKLVEDLVGEAYAKWESGEYRPVLDQGRKSEPDFTLDDAQLAHEYMESNQSNGNIVLQVDPTCEA
eukprot:g1035.t1